MERSGVVFATVSVPGSAAGFTINDSDRAAEAMERNRANVAWIKSTFEQAIRKEAKAVVLGMHASLFEDGDGGSDFGKRLRGGVEGPYYWLALAISAAPTVGRCSSCTATSTSSWSTVLF